MQVVRARDSPPPAYSTHREKGDQWDSGKRDIYVPWDPVVSPEMQLTCWPRAESSRLQAPKQPVENEINERLVYTRD
jgi:hypothetical protein